MIHLLKKQFKRIKKIVYKNNGVFTYSRIIYGFLFYNLMINNWYIVVLGKNVCLPGSAECKGNMMYLCDVNANWITTDCPNNTECLLNDGLISCGKMNKSQVKELKKEREMKKDKKNKDRRSDDSNNEEDEKLKKKKNDEKKKGNKKEEDTNEKKHNKRKKKGDDKNNDVQTVVTVKTVYLDDSETNEDDKYKKHKNKKKNMNKKNRKDDTKSKKIFLDKNLIGDNKDNTINSKNASRIDPVLTIPIIIPKHIISETLAQQNAPQQENNNQIKQQPAPEQLQAGPGSITQPQQQSPQPTAPAQQQQQQISTPGSTPAPGSSIPQQPSQSSVSQQPTQSSPGQPSVPQQPSSGETQPSASTQNGPAQKSDPQQTPTNAAPSDTKPESSSAASQSGQNPPSPQPSSASSGGEAPKPGTGPTPGDTKNTNTSKKEETKTSDTSKKDDKTDKSSKDTTTSGGGGNLGITASKLDEIVTKCGLKAKKEYLEPVAKGISEGFKSKDMAAIFLAQIIHESGGLAHIEEIKCAKNPGSCAANYDDKKGAPGKSYYGRGFIQLSWSANYKAASKGIGMGDKLWSNPDLVAKDPKIGIKVSIWFWKKNVEPKLNKSNLRFGDSTKAINGALECKGKNVDKSKKRYKYYTIVADVLGIKKKASEAGCY